MLARLLLILMILMPSVAWGQVPVAGPLTRESRGTLLPQLAGNPVPCLNFTGFPLLSMTDRQLAFSSTCPLEPADVNMLADVYVRDFAAGTTRLISATAAGVVGNGASSEVRLTADETGVVFKTFATNLVPGVGVNGGIVFKDLATGAMELISVGVGGAAANGTLNQPDVSADGRFVTFSSGAINLTAGDTEGQFDVFLRDRALGTTIRLSQTIAGVGGNGASFWPRISSDGSALSFCTTSANLGIASQVIPSFFGTVVYDVASQSLEVVSVGPNTTQSNGVIRASSISADGRFVAFLSRTPLLASAPIGRFSAYVRDRQLNTTSIVSVSSTGVLANGVEPDVEITGDGRFVIFRSDDGNLVPNDNNGVPDVFVHDRSTGTTIRANVSAQGEETGPLSTSGALLAIDRSGRRVAFSSSSSNLAPMGPCVVPVLCTDLFVADLGPSINLGAATWAGATRPYTRVVEQPGLNQWVLSLIDAPTSSPALLALATNPGTPVPFGIGSLVPWPPDLLLNMSTDLAGRATLVYSWPVSVPLGTQVWAQWGIADPMAPMGISLSNACSVARP